MVYGICQCHLIQIFNEWIKLNDIKCQLMCENGFGLIDSWAQNNKTSRFTWCRESIEYSYERLPETRNIINRNNE